ncbi:M48 family metallopeptidase [Pedobacter agri]|uniref:M48 family metalloprotease n=1 Tax=Pedobacter agri TaxID=454586 RepID=A0A9X3IB28_9SPHI|nr:M48 family metallopeptidase [Pedobacter agri]MCX3266965.1 M48 family metalloprotease [Pedobacter agri]
MLENALKPSKDFRRTAIKSIWAILLFIFTYIFLIVISVTLTLVCGYLGIKLMEFYTHFYTILLGLGMIGFGFLILFFLIKFMFKHKKTDRSHLVEVTRVEEPKLFSMIDEIISAVQTDFPKKVYLSAEVNASVFYDSNFWSMFLPIRKNLQIGMGLINTTTINELKAILAHEFGHFSQKSMKVGSYVYNANSIIHDILYDNESYNQVTGKIAESNSYLGIFVLASDKIIVLMQEILVKVYGVLNTNYSKLSHEMEYHADAVAGHVVGSKPLINSLLRMQLANQAFDTVLSYYNRKIEANIKTADVYPQQLMAMNFIAKANKLTYTHFFPEVNLSYYNRFNKSKLSFNHEYSSHPETEDRIRRLELLNAGVEDEQDGLAVDLLVKKDEIAAQLTGFMFAGVNYSNDPVNQSAADFEVDLIGQNDDHSFPDEFNGYFDFRNPFTKYSSSDFAKPNTITNLSIVELFGEENLSLIYDLNALEADYNVIDRLDSGLIEAKTFTYSGLKYSKADSRKMLEYLNAEMKTKMEQLDDIDFKIFEHFRLEARAQDVYESFERLAISYQQIANKFKEQQIIYTDLLSSTSFLHSVNHPNFIKNKIVLVKKEEKRFKESILFILEDDQYRDSFKIEERLRLKEYLNHDYKYFGADLYFDEELKVLFAALEDYLNVITQTHFAAKKALLVFQASLIAPVKHQKADSV